MCCSGMTFDFGAGITSDTGAAHYTTEQIERYNFCANNSQTTNWRGPKDWKLTSASGGPPFVRYAIHGPQIILEIFSLLRPIKDLMRSFFLAQA